MSNYPGPIPDRWLNCPRQSRIIADTFLAVKTPLGPRFDPQVPPANLFAPLQLISNVKATKNNIGLWIDLTNTERFYDRTDVTSSGIKYVKMGCKGHGECPTQNQVKSFVTVCKTFKERNPADIIVVHCTHGFNRTGLMIASYLILELEWSCDMALKEFAKARHPGIYKGDYIKEMFARFDDPDAAPPPPELPEWCLEGRDTEDHDDPPQASAPRQRTERILQNATFMEGVPGVTLVTDPAKVNEIRTKAQSFCYWKKTGFPGSQPVSMTHENKQLMASMPYRVSWKADGTRYMMLIDGYDEVYFLDRNNSVFQASLLIFPEKYDLSKPIADTLLDGEMVIEKIDDLCLPRYLIYDAVRIRNKDIIRDNFHMRYERIRTDILMPREGAIQAGLFTKADEPFSIRRKDFWDCNHKTTATILSDDFKSQLTHEPDGLILQPLMEPYVPGPAPLVLKWKPPSHNSVDFRLKISTHKAEGMLPETIGNLFVGGSDQPFDRIKVTRALRPYDGKIIECNVVNKRWNFMRERTDKTFPNGFKTAKAVMDTIINPVTEDCILSVLYNKLLDESESRAKRQKTNY